MPGDPGGSPSYPWGNLGVGAKAKDKTMENLKPIKYPTEIGFEKKMTHNTARVLLDIPLEAEEPIQKPYNRAFEAFALIGAIVGCTILIFLASCIHSKPAHAYSFSDSDAIKAIIGEAEDQGYRGMLAVACAIRNRGTLKGVYGLRSARVRNYEFSRQTHKMAFLAWAESEKVDITNGATHWENIKAFGTPCWVKKCIEVFRHKDHVFYKEIA